MPILCVFELIIFTLKQPSPSVNPATQLGSDISIPLTKGLSIGVIVGKASINAGERPLFSEALILKI